MKQTPTPGLAARIAAALLITLALLLPAAASAGPWADTAPETGTISGIVYRDYNANGARDNTSSFREPGIGGIIITAYDVNNAVAGSTSSAADGSYSFTATGSSGFRVEFTLPADGSLDFLQAGAAVSASGRTSVVFAPTGGQTGLNVGFNNPSDYSQTDPPLVTVRTAFGPRLASGGMAGLPNWSSGASANANESVIGIPYPSDGNLTPSNAHSVYATLRQTGTLYGLLYGRRAKLILAGTFFKSYADTGPKITGQAAGSQWEWLNDVDPLGAIYGIQPTALTSNPADIPTATNARVYANLNKIIDPGTGQVITGNPAGVDPRRTGTINYDSGSFGDCDGPGAGGAPANPSSGNTCWHHDPAAWDKVGSIGLGDLEEDDAEKYFFVVNLGDKKLYQLPIVTDPTQWPVKTLAASPVAVPNTCANTTDGVPGGLGFKDGKLYVGVTCTAKSSGNAADLKAEVWQFDPKTQAFSASPVFSMSLGYPRGCIFSDTSTPNNGVNSPKNVPGGILTTNCQKYKDGSPNAIDGMNWLPWPTTWQTMFEGNKGINGYGKPGQANTDMVQIEYPHPWLSDISFDGDDLVIGFRDVAGDRSGNTVRSPNVTTTTALPTTNTNIDNFGAQAYNNSNGSIAWAGDWTEVGDDSSATTGDIRILADSALSAPNYQLRLSGASNSIRRAVSTTLDAASEGKGTLSFAYRRQAMSSGMQVLVEVSTNGGSTYATVGTIDGSTNDPTYRTAIFDITLSNNTIVRFSTNGSMTVNNFLWIDNVHVTNQNKTWMSAKVYGNTNTAYTGSGFGDLMRACKSGGSWTLESNGTCGSITTGGKDNGQGPGSGTYPTSLASPFIGYGEFYWDDSGPGSRNPSVTAGVSGSNYIGHEQTMQGGTFQRPGSPDIAVTISDQFGYGDGGIARFSNVADHPDINNYDANGNLKTSAGTVLTYPTILSDNDPNNNVEAGLALKHTQLYDNTSSFFAKANGLGDVEALLDSPPMEIGNRVWCDTGVSGAGVNNGIQDPGEATVPDGTTVRLTCGAEYAEVTTSGGAYLFTDTIWNNSANTTSTVIPREANCKVSIATTGQNATNLTNACGGIAATVPNADGKTDNNPLTDIRDSDATVVRSGGSITSAEVAFLTGGPGVNNHALDLAFGPERDWGDAPDSTYPTLITSNGARHTIVAGIRMGATIDGEQNGQPNTGATGDDQNNTDDEDGVTFGALAAGQPANAKIDMTTLPSGEVCKLNAWIDFNGDGDWGDTGEQIATNFALNGGAVQTLNFNVPAAVTTSPTYARFRCSTQQNLQPTGLATDGEVEDYQVTIQQNGSLDYGDAPDPTYPTLSASGGASHLLGATGPRLGACVDAETNGQPNTGATGDDTAVGSPIYGTCANNDDEDGVAFPTLTEGVQANITVNVSQATCKLNAWIDWNGDGVWGAGEQIATDQNMVIGANTVTVTPPSASTQATTYARFRCSATAGLGATGAAADGEVEDYAITIQPGTALNDWGDAPDPNYPTLGASNGAHHLIANNVWLGACVDAEVNGQPASGATGDDTGVGSAGYGTCAVAGDDEDGVSIPTLLAGQTAQIQVTRNASAAACSLSGWIDFNGDGDWNDTGEQVATNVSLATGVNNLNVAVPAGAVGGQTYARFRCSTVQNLKPTGVATDGEVEDYAIQVTATAVDWGDLPDPQYPTLSGSNGAAHALSGVAFLGKCVDAENNGQPNSGATGDDTTVTSPRLGTCASGDDDEDGVTFGALAAGQAATANIDMTAFQSGANVCFLNAWIDFNGNGSLTDAGEQIASNIQMVGGAVRTVNFNIPVAVTAASTGARFRCSTQSGLLPTGQANDGEVEDYMVTLTPQARDFGDAPDTGPGTGAGNYRTTVGDDGPNHLIVSGLNLGNVAPDQDSGALQNVNADADDTTGTDDEDSITTLPSIDTTTTNVSMTVRATNTTGTAATLACWIDFNRDGSFLGAGEKSANVTVPATSNSANYTVNFAGFGAPVAGDAYIRCRIAYVASEISGPTGPAASGEVEDFKVTITQPLDFGDLPDTTANTGAGDYETLLANNGPRHAIVSGVQLGAQIDAELNGQPSSAATGDDLAGATPDDEDGVVFANPLVPGKKANIQATASVAGCLNAWVDWNGNGVLTDAGEQIATDLAVISGVNTITVSSVPAGTTGVVYSRFRFTQACQQGGGQPSGAASTGEVEDYALASLGDFVWSDTNGNGQQDTGEPGVAGVTVKLLNGSGNPVNDADGNPITVVTDADGKYEFPGLPPGNYGVEFVPPVGSGFTTPNVGNDATDSDADQTTGRTGSVVLNPGAKNMTLDAGLVPLPLDFGDLPDTTANTGAGDYQTLLANNGPRHVIVSGVRLGPAIDSEANGQPDTPATGDDAAGATPDDEDGVVFQTPLVPGSNGKIQVTASVAGCLNAWIDWNGNGQLGDVAGEQIATDLAVAAGANALTVNSVPQTTGVVYSRFRFTQSCGQGAGTPLGLASSGEVEDYALASLGDYVWNDTDKDGKQGGGETGVAGVTVKLLDSAGNPVLDGAGNPITDVTDNNGKYEFPGLPAGTYKVEFVPPGGSSFTQPDQGGDDTKDSDADVATGRTPSVTLNVGDVDTTLDAGLVPVADTAIGNMVWCDANQDAVKQTGESPIANVTVRLYNLGPNNTPYDGDDVLLRTLATDSNGRYIFLAVPAGQYYVAVDSTTVPSGCNAGSSPGGGHNPDIGDQDIADGDDGAPLKLNETVSGVITTAIDGQTTPDTGNPLGYTNSSAYMTVDFGFTPGPTAVKVQDLRAESVSPVEQLIRLLNNWLNR